MEYDELELDTLGDQKTALFVIPVSYTHLYQTAEDGLGDTVKPRLMEAEADLESCLLYTSRCV